MTRSACLGVGALTLLMASPAPADESPAVPPAAAFASAGDDAVQDLVILGETRPILIRLRVLVGGRPFRRAWADSARKSFAKVDRNDDGKLDAAEAEAGALGPAPRRPWRIAEGTWPSPPRRWSRPSARPRARSRSGPSAWPTGGRMPCSSSSTATATVGSIGSSWRRSSARSAGSTSTTTRRFGVDEIALADNSAVAAAPAMTTPGPGRPGRGRIPGRDRAGARRGTLAPGPDGREEVRRRLRSGCGPGRLEALARRVRHRPRRLRRGRPQRRRQA